jgi:hypothetical protein
MASFSACCQLFTSPAKLLVMGEVPTLILLHSQKQTQSSVLLTWFFIMFQVNVSKQKNNYSIFQNTTIIGIEINATQALMKTGSSETPL